MNIDDYIFLNRKVLKFVGLYPINFLRYIACTVCMSLIVIPQTVQIWQYWQDLDVILETCSILLTILLAVLKSIVWISNRRQVEAFIEFMVTNYWNVVESHLSEHLNTYATYAKKVTRGYVFLICNALLFFFSIPPIQIIIATVRGNGNYTKHFPFVATYPERFHHFPFYEIVYLSQMVATCICGIIIVATDTLIATALFHTCAHFKVLEEDLKALDKKIHLLNNMKQSSSKREIIATTVRNKIGRIISHHQMILWFCNVMEDNFNPILLLQTLASSLIICLVGLQVSTTLTERYKLIEYFSYLLMALFQLLLFCFPGDNLINQSFLVNRAIYSIRWYDLPMQIKNEVCLMMMRAQKPSCVTAGKFYVMHLENFSAVLSTSLSYFMVLRSFNPENDDV